MALLHVTIEPAHRPLQRIQTMLRLAQAVAFAWIADEDCLDAASLQRHVHLFGLGDVNVVVVFAVEEQCRSLHLPHVTQR